MASIHVVCPIFTAHDTESNQVYKYQHDCTTSNYTCLNEHAVATSVNDQPMHCIVSCSSSVFPCLGVRLIYW